MGGIRPLVESLQPSRPDGSPSKPITQANAALALQHLCRNHTPNQTTVAEYGGLGQLGTLMRPDRNNKDGPGVVEAEAAGALWSLAEANEANKVSIAGSGAIGTMCMLIGSTNERAQKYAASALSSLCSGSVPNMEETTKLLVSALHGGTPDAKERVLKSLWRLVRDNSEQKVSGVCAAAPRSRPRAGCLS